ncbi:hypothetical protein EUX98_g8731 [Antrodiella citrinella]|uniref:Uncharacterized protein n=1 Tax=Antrodiella citrinella TaxID=2447956 RepID=A0A4S4M3H0_9APHY|nr:hypothetical protein EUX98_g8731 [Antrodiella citrinella]
MRCVFSHFNYLQTVYNALQDGINLVQRGNWTHFIQRPGSNETQTEMGLWSITCASIPNVQTLSGNHTNQMWMLFSNENSTTTWAFDCTSPDWIPSPYPAPVTVRNLFSPYETYMLQDLLSSYNNDSKAPFFGRLPAVTLDLFDFKALVPETKLAPLPTITKFLHGHNARIQAESGDANATSLDITLEFNVPMDCASVTAAISFNMSSSGHGGSPSIGTPKCGNVTNPGPASVTNADISQFSWSTTLTNVSDGILTITVTNPTESAQE